MDSFSIVGANGLYHFKINHLKTKDMPIGECITSPTFRVGRHDWVILYYPRGIDEDNSGKYVSIFLQLQRKSIDVTAAFRFAILDKHGNISVTALEEFSQTFTSDENDWGLPTFLERTELEEAYLKDGYLVFNVSVTVKKESYRAEQNAYPIGFPCNCLQEFREENKQIDITFEVDGKHFVAHRLILAVNSPVFEAELFGSMAESNVDCISIHEMLPSVFEAMLDFMYTGSLAETIDGEEQMPSTSFLQHLLVAADRYAVEKLKAICQDKLAENISLSTALTFLEFAEKHSCIVLKKKCLEFIVDEKNMVPLLLTERYIKLMQDYPSLLAELTKMACK